MLRDAWFLSRSDFRLMLREREILLWAFAMPLMFFYFIGTITGGFGGKEDRKDTLGVFVPGDAGFLADQLLSRLETQYALKRVDTPEGLAKFNRQLRMPEHFTERVLAGQQSTLQLHHKNTGLGGDYDDFRINRAVYTLLADLIIASQGGEVPTGDSLQAVAARPRQLTIAHENAGKKKEIPTGFQQSVPGTTVFLVLLVMATTGVGLVQEREQGLLRRLASSPMRRGAVVAGKWGARVLLSLTQVVFAVIVGALFFKIQWGPHYWAVALILLAYIALTATLGMLLGNCCSTQTQVIAAGVAGSNVLAALGGCWWPIEITPTWCQQLAKLLPTGWVMDALHQLMSFGADPSVVLPHFAALVIAAIACGWWVARSFRFV
jgi:ABC-type multidrug transport system permease subunit